MLLFVKMDLKRKDVQNLERCQHIGTAYQIVMLEAVKENIKHQVIKDLRLKLKNVNNQLC
mgnify:FL=1